MPIFDEEFINNLSSEKELDPEWLKHFIVRDEMKRNSAGREYAKLIADELKKTVEDHTREAIHWDMGIEEPPKMLFKYRDWENPFHKNILSKREIWFSHIDDLNDPLEFRQAIDDPTVGLSIKNAQIRQQLGAKNGILSLSRKNNDPLSWAHYANNHFGFCVGFDTEQIWNDSKGILLPVIYDNRPLITPIAVQEGISTSQQLMAKKATDWEYEGEIRIIGKTVNDKLIIRETTIRQIIFGCRMNERNKDEIREICSDFSKISIFDLSMHDDGVSYYIERNS